MALAWVSEATEDADGYHETLAAEVRALREEVARTPAIAQAAATLQRNVDTIAHNMVIAQRDELQATIARAEALPAKWREKAARPRSPLFTNAEHALAKFTLEGCADELDAAMRGENHG
jgi:hypothetical protein